MAQIIVERSHNLGRDAAREKADELAARLQTLAADADRIEVAARSG